MRVRVQRGAFVVEAALSMTLIVVILFFIADLSQILLAKTQANRVSYSITTAMKERYRFFDTRHDISQSDFELVSSIAGGLLADNGTYSDYGIAVGGYTDNGVQEYFRSFESGESCIPQESISELEHLRPVRDDGVVFPIYQVTVCLRVEGFSDVFPGMNYVSSSSVLPGR
ncbi:tight adherence pilus pseudopilin TadF [Vibrio comitans]|uniref:Pilus assembly protein n=1 Tax=Vibrio comitans NBRC 102076 TaxID=1219078 RepID=A0A4Y3IMP0_9VIBR|nr:tight adherence pilus pseudopilin TadF [Vibrio comitans]GEA60676.1 hypothetical protein VCO01S_18690 [Vibrio comitans NBRC 102076]